MHFPFISLIFTVSSDKISVVVSCTGRHGGLMVSALVSGLSSWVRHFTLTVPLSTQEYKWVPANLMLEVTLRWTSNAEKRE